MLVKTAAASIGYYQLMQELTRRSAYFCEKACAGGLILLLLESVKQFAVISVLEVSRCKFTLYFLFFYVCSAKLNIICVNKNSP